MFRAVALSIALTLAAGPTAAQLCKALCSPESAARSECHHDASTTSPSVASNSNCDRAALSVGTFFREEIKRPVSPSYGSHAIHIPRYQDARLTSAGRSEQQTAHDWSLASRPLITALRI